jgi:hypothetical protein
MRRISVRVGSSVIALGQRAAEPRIETQGQAKTRHINQFCNRFPPKADIAERSLDVRFVPKADMRDLFNHHVSASNERGRHVNAIRLGSFKIDHQFTALPYLS